MNTRSLERRARLLSDKLAPRPRLIHCAGDVNALLARLQWQIEQEGGDINAPVEWSAGDLEIGRELNDWLEQECDDIERRCNVRFVE